MLFSSISFIYYFLPVILIIYYLTPRRFKNLILLLSSLLFYFAGEPKYTALLLISTAVDFTHSKIIVKHRGTKKAKWALISSICINLAMLGVFKYSDFVVSNLNNLFSLSLVLPNLRLPIGISFFTFQTMSYTIDVYRNEAKVQNSIIGLGTYVSLFPQLIAGPIVRYKTISEELNNRIHSYENFAYGVSRFLVGLAKKVLIANSLGEFAEMIYLTNDISVFYYWITAIAYSLQIYYDFSGYSDMAIGLGRMFGFHFLENFNYPYVSKSISEFWRRWHISLGQWFRDYVYLPLGGNRVSQIKWFRNIVIVWFLTGLWHGASWNFVIWGMLFALLLIVEKYYLLTYLRRTKILAHLYVIISVILSFVIFRHDSITEIMIHFKSMFGLNGIPLSSHESIYYFKSYFVTFVIAIIGATPVVKQSLEKIKGNHIGKMGLKLLEPIFYVIVLLIITGYLVDSSFNPFLYFRF
jgi:alginate O-acetyltransferase complex protein AlgI